MLISCLLSACGNFGTKSYEDKLEISRKYLLVNHSDVIKDLSKKGGEYSKNLAKMLEIDHQKMIEWSDENINEVVELDPVDLHLELSMI